jgi:hypothetical protein
MTPNELVAFGVGVISIATALLLALRWVIKSFLSELKPNSGSSIKDQISRLETQSLQLQQRVDDLFVLISKR